MKRVWTLVLSVMLLFCSGVLFAQGRVHIEQEGHSVGAVSSIELNGLTYVEVQRTTRKLGAQVELFATSKQAKITAKGFFAILTAFSTIIVTSSCGVVTIIIPSIGRL